MQDSWNIPAENLERKQYSYWNILVRWTACSCSWSALQQLLQEQALFSWVERGKRSCPRRQSNNWLLSCNDHCTRHRCRFLNLQSPDIIPKTCSDMELLAFSHTKERCIVWKWEVDPPSLAYRFIDSFTDAYVHRIKFPDITTTNESSTRRACHYWNWTKRV